LVRDGAHARTDLVKTRDMLSNAAMWATLGAFRNFEA
jgi:hypothetical protein